MSKVQRRAGAGFSLRVRRHSGRVRRYHVRCLPPDFPAWTVERHGTPQARWYVMAPQLPGHGGFVAIFDAHGAPVWWRRSPSADVMPWDAKLLGHGLLAWATNFGDHFGVRQESAYEAHALNGRLVRRIRTSGSPTDVHDLQPMGNGHFLGLTYRRRENVDLSAYGGQEHATVFDGEVQELTPGGKVVWRWNSRDRISPSETSRAWWYYPEFADSHPPAERGYDLQHLNSVEPDGNGVVVSGRHVNAVYRIDRATGRVDWKLGGSYVAGESLTVVPAPSGPLLGGQHDARVLADGTLTVFDNRSRTGGAPAAKRFRIDPVARTAKLIETVTEPDVPEAEWGGSARRLPGGNWVIGWGGTNLVTEQTATGAVVLALRFGGDYVTYRAQPLLPGALHASELRHGMDHMAKRPAGP
ncbi:MAG: hypothetical protein QOD53_1582 [Thermoleophilaceae bacterium]|nr:hypothetical protein [Thermoleophilaceae bacterium]